MIHLGLVLMEAQFTGAKVCQSWSDQTLPQGTHEGQKTTVWTNIRGGLPLIRLSCVKETRLTETLEKAENEHGNLWRQVLDVSPVC